MRSGTIAFSFGVLLLQGCEQLPDIGWAALLLLLPLAWMHRWLRLPVAVVAGFAWVLLRAHMTLSVGLPPELEGHDLQVEVVVASVPQVYPRRVRFHADAVLIDCADRPRQPLGRARLTWYDPPSVVRAGQRWRLLVRLKRPRGFVNPGGFDYERWLFQNRIRAIGYVRAHHDNQRIDGPTAYPLNAFRHSLHEQIETVLRDSEYKGLIAALAVGVRSAIPADHWEILMTTGTNHLVAISGLHVGLVAGLAFAVVRRLCGWSTAVVARWPAPRMAALAALGAAAAYAALAGFSVPTQRALVMVTAVMLTLLLGRARAGSHSLAAALAAVLLWDPSSVLDSGFWLSFVAVTVIVLATSGRVGDGGLWWNWGRLQWVISIGLLPLTILFFERVAAAAPLANLIAVPWMTLVVVPLTLLGVAGMALGDDVGGAVLTLGAQAIGLLWPALEGLAALPQTSWMHAPPTAWAVASALAGSGWLLLPRGFPARWLGLIAIVPMFVLTPPKLPAGDLRLTVLDVGQGLATVLRTAQRTLVFDAGPSFGDRFDTGAAVVAPFLRHVGASRVDMLVVSHGDRDHIGGVASLQRQLSVLAVRTSVPEQVSGPEVWPCRRSERWEWDGVTFELLHPPVRGRQTGNNSSCVVRVSNAAGSVLLTGDIEAEAERELLTAFGPRLASDVIVAPHHGSKTSSTAAFLSAVRPAYVVFPVGYRNRFGFPHHEVLRRYAQSGARILDTSRDGAVTLHLSAERGEIILARHRDVARRYWHAD